MARKGSSLSGLNKLIKEGEVAEEQAQKIKSVVTSPSIVIEETTMDSKELELPVTPQVEETSDKKELTVSEVKPVISEEETEEKANSQIVSKKGLEILLNKREVNDSDAVRLPRELHRELKILAGLSGISMTAMLGNLVESFINENKKEIISYKRKYLK